ncbi:chaperone DnaJ-domain superfamily protein [Tasmannia lanceolata]|uniref:chaperone DnaJ-domain superfamily protein n=1 Tax=Tasmannia lanceolata TaxID=3420 RepID=UPI004063DB92
MRNGTGRLHGRFLSYNPESCRCIRFPARSLSFSHEYSVLGLTPFASKSDIKHAYKRLALKYHPDVIKVGNWGEKQNIFKEIKSAYQSLMDKLEEEEEEEESSRVTEGYEDEYDEWEEWMGFEGGIPIIYNPS